MPCHRIDNGFLCTHTATRVYICFEARTYPLNWLKSYRNHGDAMLYKKPRRLTWRVYISMCKEFLLILSPRKLKLFLKEVVSFEGLLDCEVRELPRFFFEWFICLFVVVTVPFLFWLYAAIATGLEWRRYRSRMESETE